MSADGEQSGPLVPGSVSESGCDGCDLEPPEVGR